MEEVPQINEILTQHLEYSCIYYLNFLGSYTHRGTPWHTLVPLGALWYLVLHCGTPRYNLIPCGTLWYPMVHSGTPWHTVIPHGTLWYTVVLLPSEEFEFTVHSLGMHIETHDELILRTLSYLTLN